VERALPRLVILDLGLPGLYGTSLAITLRAEFPGLPFIVVSALQADAVAQDAWSIGAAAYLTKPFDCDELLATVRRVLAASRRILVRRRQRSPRPRHPSPRKQRQGERANAGAQSGTLIAFSGARE